MGQDRPQALLTTPAEVAYCAPCESYGARFPGDVATFPHCPVCGSTDLVDTRSPFEVLYEARILAMDPCVDPGTRMARQDVADRVAALTVTADPNHCSDCTEWSRKAPAIR